MTSTTFRMSWLPASPFTTYVKYLEIIVRKSGLKQILLSVRDFVILQTLVLHKHGIKTIRFVMQLGTHFNVVLLFSTLCFATINLVPKQNLFLHLIIAEIEQITQGKIIQVLWKVVHDSILNTYIVNNTVTIFLSQKDLHECVCHSRGSCICMRHRQLCQQLLHHPRKHQLHSFITLVFSLSYL